MEPEVDLLACGGL